MAGGGDPVRAVLFAFGANLGIALVKTGATVATGSSAMLAEAIHSFADTANQLLLLLGIRRSRRPPDAEHPLGYGKLTYFWSFIVAMLLFSVGGLFSLYEGWHKLAAPEPLEQAWIALGVLAAAIGLESASMYGCLREVNAERRGRTLWRWLQDSRSSELIVVFGEDLAALAGLALAFAFVTIAAATGDPRYDAFGSMAIGMLLILVSIFLAVRIRSLLIGRSADPDLEAGIAAEIAGEPRIVDVLNVITVQMGPKVMLAAKIRLDDALPVAEAARLINDLEVRLKTRFPEIGWCFMEPDVTD